MSGTQLLSSRRRNPSESMGQCGDGELSWVDVIGSEWSNEWMSEQSFLMTMMFYCNIPVFLFNIKRLNILCILKVAWGICTYV